jgi:hypothetical protein
MSINLIIPETSIPVARKFSLPQRLSNLLDLYVNAAKSDAADPSRISDSVVLEAILEEHFRKDKPFREWLSQNGQRTGAYGLKRPMSPVRKVPSAGQGEEE